MRVITIARKPLSEGNVASNVLKWGCGGINIDGCRINSQGETLKGGAGGLLSNVRDSKPYPEDNGYQPSAAGRFPANLILSHLPGCRCVGEREVATGMAYETSGGDKPGSVYNGGWGRRDRCQGYANPNGKESVPAWACQPGCPVQALDIKSGDCPSTLARFGLEGKHPHPSLRHTPGYIFPNICGGGFAYGDKGGASRFFKQVKP